MITKEFVAFFLGSLPWQRLKAGTKKQKYEMIREKKMLTPIEVSQFPLRLSLLANLEIQHNLTFVLNVMDNRFCAKITLQNSYPTSSTADHFALTISRITRT